MEVLKLPPIPWLHTTWEFVLKKEENCKKLSDKEFIGQVMLQLARMTQLTPRDDPFIYQFESAEPEKNGITAFLALKEGSIDVHTWPEYTYGFIDLFSYETLDLDEIGKFIKQAFGCKKCWRDTVRRGEIILDSYNDYNDGGIPLDDARQTSQKGPQSEWPHTTWEFVLEKEEKCKKLIDKEFIIRLMLELTKVTGLTSRGNPLIYRFGDEELGEGITAFLVLAESSIDVHTLLGARYGFVDLFACKNLNLNEAGKVIKRMLGPGRYRRDTVWRGEIIAELWVDTNHNDGGVLLDNFALRKAVWEKRTLNAKYEKHKT